MILKLNPITAISLACTFFFLAIKGPDGTTFGDIEFLINHPAIIFPIKDNALTLGIISLSIYLIVLILLRKKKRLTMSPFLLGIIIPTLYYYFRSATISGDWLLNIIAILVCLLFFYAIQLSLKVENKTLNNSNLYKALLYFYATYTFITLALFLTGYGYLHIGSTRFFGLASHPNSLGQVASLAFGFFIVSNLDKDSSIKKLAIPFALISLSCAVLSGSRAAILMCGICALVFSGRIAMFVFIASLIVGISLTFSASSIMESQGSFSIAIDRMISAPLDNREQVWSLLWDDFLMNPLLGVGDSTAVSGSAYLSALSGTGIFFGLIYILSFFKLTIEAFKVLLTYRASGQNKTTLIFAITTLQLVIGAFFEARLFDKMSHMVLIFILCACVVLYPKKPLSNKA